MEQGQSQRGKSGRPRGLSGKAIGLYYRDLGAKQRQEKTEQVNEIIRTVRNLHHYTMILCIVV